ncbi:MAG: hypothetical protein Q8M26_03510 [Pseudolabrys sp.]|nr:hypothetical protein [Pseudolabrys sp.]
MNAQSAPSHGNPRWCIPESTCRFCIAFEPSLCDAAADEPKGPRQSGHVVPARHILWRERDLHDVVPFICSGWGTTFLSLSNGRRQITSFLLPGDIISAAFLIDSQPNCRIEAIADVYYRVFNRVEFRARLCKQPNLLELF